MLRKLKWSYQAFESAKSNNNTVINRPGCCNDKKDYRGVKFSFEKLDIKVITIKYIGIESFIVLMRAIRCILGFSFFLAVSQILSINVNSINVEVLKFAYVINVVFISCVIHTDYKLLNPLLHVASYIVFTGVSNYKGYTDVCAGCQKFHFFIKYKYFFYFFPLLLYNSFFKMF